MKLKLTQHIANTRTLPEGKDEVLLWDVEVEKLALRLRRSADGMRRTWIVQYRVHGRTRREKLGDKLTLAQARAEARRILARVELGHDLKAEKSTKRAQAARTFASAVELYLAAKAHLRPGSLRLNRLYLCGPYSRPLNNVPLAELTRADIAARLTAIASDYGSGTAAAARRCISALMSWAMQEGWIESNPVVGTRKPPLPPSRDRVLDNAELAAIWRAARDTAGDYGRIIRLLVLAACRRQEVGGMTWSELDADAGTWTIPAARSKNGKAHCLPLPQQAWEIIQSVPRTAGRDNLFGERADHGFVVWSKHKARFDKRLGDGVRPWTLHDLRRTAATRMADLAVQPHIIEQILNHSSGHKAGIAGIYNRSSYQREVVIALQRWSEHVLALAEGRAGSNVVSIISA
jgi:integrase